MTTASALARLRRLELLQADARDASAWTPADVKVRTLDVAGRWPSGLPAGALFLPWLADREAAVAELQALLDSARPDEQETIIRVWAQRHDAEWDRDFPEPEGDAE